MVRTCGTSGIHTLAGCSKRPSSKAAGESKPEAYPRGYVEDFDEPRTKLADIFSILLTDKFHFGKEISNLELGGLRRIGSMHGVKFDIRPMGLANRARLRLGWIGRTH